MNWYKWNNGGCNYRIDFEPEWSRFHQCNALTYYTHKYKTVANTELSQQHFYLMSYATPIIAISRCYYFGSGNIKYTHVIVNEDSFNCSSTTIHQLSRYLTEIDYKYGIGVRYHDIKRAMKELSGSNDVRYAIDGKTYIYPVSSGVLEVVFHNRCPHYHAHRI